MIKKALEGFKTFITRKKKTNNKINSCSVNNSPKLAKQRFIKLRKNIDTFKSKTSVENDKKTLRQYTKVIISTLVVCAIIWITWSYVLATVSLIKYMSADLTTSLSEKVCDVVLGAVLAYCLKSFFETFAEKSMDIVKNHLEHSYTYNEPVDTGISNDFVEDEEML